MCRHRSQELAPTSDPYAHHAWAKALGNDFDKIEFLADTDGSFAKAYGLDVDYSAASLGVRSKRFSMFVRDGETKIFHVVEDAQQDASTLLGAIKELNDA